MVDQSEFLSEFLSEVDAASPGSDKSILSLWANDDVYDYYLQTSRSFPRRSDFSKMLLGEFSVVDIETSDADFAYNHSPTRNLKDTTFRKYTREYTYSLIPPDQNLISSLDSRAALDDLRDGFDKAAWMAYYYGAPTGVNNMGAYNIALGIGAARNERTIMLLSPDRSKTEMHDSLSARDLVNVGWTRVDSLACEACHGVGTINGEVCWHCEGEKLDPVLTEDLV